MCVGLVVSVFLGPPQRRPHDRASLKTSANLLHGRHAAANPKIIRPSLTQCRHANLWKMMKWNTSFKYACGYKKVSGYLSGLKKNAEENPKAIQQGRAISAIHLPCLLQNVVSVAVIYNPIMNPGRRKRPILQCWCTNAAPR